MRGSVIINDTDIADFGAFILKGGDYDFLTLPERTEPPQNNWFEYDGLDVDLSEVFFKARTLSVSFHLSATDSFEYEFNVNSFYKLISQGYIDLYSREFARTFRLRYLSCSDFKHRGGLYRAGRKQGSFNISFSMDNPLQLFTRPEILEPVTTKQYSASGILINDIDLARFGIVVQECYSSIFTMPTVKAPLTRSFARRSGLLAYPSNKPTFEAKEIIVKCTMAAATREEFYYNYEALFNNLRKEGALDFKTYLGQTQCYYSKMDGFRKNGIFANGVMVGFNLRLIQIDAGLTLFVLGAEDGTALLTEDGEFIEITK